MQKFSYLNRNNLEYVEQLFEQFKRDPHQVQEDWRLFFEGMEFALENSRLSPAPSSAWNKELDVYNLISAYRDYGHLKARLDPLELNPPDEDFFALKNFHLSEQDLESSFEVCRLLGLTPNTPLKEVIAHLEKSYCQTLTSQVAHCRPEVRQWFQKQMEGRTKNFALSKDEKQEVFAQLARTESLEKFIHTRYVGTKRFSIEGGDAMIPMLESLVQRGTALNLEEIVIGMAHRGRINVLANFMGKALNIIFAEFEGVAKGDSDYDGDVKYHLGYSADKETPNGPCHISLAFNPSHLEAVNPVVMGMARAKQRRRRDMVERKKVIPVLIHGDAAFSGQGVVSETLQMSRLPGYKVGGTIHIIVNNQVGFTTDPSQGRSTRYSSDVARAIEAPILLVNGDDVEACVAAMDMALRFRQEFSEDVVIDLICYRRFGHNEGDEPGFTQPLMYDRIKKHPTLFEIYTDQLCQEGLMDKEEAAAFYKQRIDNLQAILDETRKSPPEVKPNSFDGLWKGLRRGRSEDFELRAATAAQPEVIQQVSQVLTTPPKDFNLHPKLQRLLNSRKEMVEKGQVDWALGELFAYGSLCVEGTPVRLSGQDCKRGTFTHRQAVYFDTKTNEEFSPLSQLNPEEGEFVIYNSLLSEMGVLGFEYGNSCSDPTYLTLWEAQFGDFANGAQIIIDQFLSSGEEKWARCSGLTLLLPHGYEGQGPEHSSARLERFLQLCAQTNMQVMNLTTPANLFHALRRQVRREFRKPLIVMSPKSLLRHPKVLSPLSDLSQGHFQEILDDPKVEDGSQVETLILCSGKLYYDLDKAREEVYPNSSHVAVLRAEQLYPFPKVQIAPFINGFGRLKRLIWAQEEPQNMGSWLYIRPHLEQLLEELGHKKISPEYVGRPHKASPATGSPRVHQREQEEIIQRCFS